MFFGASAFNQPIGNWNTARVTNMAIMFFGASAFNQPIGDWNTARVTSMTGMLLGASAFNEPIDTWNTARVTAMSGMFGAASRFNRPIGNWNTGRVVDMSGMFQGAARFNRPIGRWDTSRVKSMSGMFYAAARFNQPIGNWNTGRVVDMSGMFQRAARFNRPIGRWDTSRVKSMSGMFYAATHFNQPIGNWNTGRVGNMNRMFGNGSRLSISNYNQLLIGWAGKRHIHHVHLDAGASTYNGAARLAHSILHTRDGWTISDGGRTTRRGVPQITALPRIAPIIFGHKITNRSVRGGAANTRGRFFLTRSQLALSAGTHRLTVVFRPRDTIHYSTVTTTVLVRVMPRHLTLGLTGLRTMPHGTSVIVTVVHVVPGARVTVGLQLTGNPAVYTNVIARGASVRVALTLPTIGTYTVTASATKTNYVFTGATGLVAAT